MKAGEGNFHLQMLESRVDTLELVTYISCYEATVFCTFIRTSLSVIQLLFLSVFHRIFFHQNH